MNPPSATAGNAADVWEVLDHLLDDVSQMARSGAAPEAFYFELLRRSVDAVSALGGAAWEFQQGTLVRRGAYTATDAALDLAHHPLLDWAVRRGEPFDVAARTA